MPVARRTIGGLHRPITLPVLAIIGVAVSVATFLVVQHIIRSGKEVHFTRTAEQYHQALKERLDTQNLFLHALAGRFSGAPPETQADFSTAVAQLRPFSPALESVGWLQGAGIAFLDPAAPAPPGLDGIRPGNGLDAYPALAQTAERACAGNRIVTAPAGALSVPPHYTVLMPVSQTTGGAADGGYAGGHPCAAFDGVLLAFFEIGRLLDDALNTLPPLNADLYLVEEQDDGALVQLAVHPAPRRHAVFALADDGALPTALPLAAGSGTWQMVLLPQPAPLFGDGFGMAWSLLGGGLLLTAIMWAYLYREARAQIMLQTEARARAAMARMLRESEERFRLALRHSKVSVFSQDRRLRYIWIYNPQIAVPPSRFLGRTEADLFTDDTAAVLESIKQEVMDTGIGIRREVTAIPRDPDTGEPGAEHVFDLVVEPLRDGSTITGVICAAVDVTEAALLRDALADAHAEAQRANQAKTRFLAAASHDLRQPFQAMSLFHHTLMARLDDPTLRDIATKLGDAMTAGSALLNALLDTSALEAGTVKPRLEVFPFQTVALRLGTEIAGQAVGKGLSLRTVATSALVRSDPVLLERLLRNLLVNALRYTRTGRILLGCRRRGDRLLVQVWDTGPGIPAAQQERIFDDFFRGDSGTEDGAHGLGLGLATVRRMALLLDHPVSVRSVEGRGTVFSVSVPMVAAPLRNSVAAMQ